MNRAAQTLGRLARGVPKNFTAEERERRRKMMIALNALRKKPFGGKKK